MKESSVALNENKSIVAQPLEDGWSHDCPGRAGQCNLSNFKEITAVLLQVFHVLLDLKNLELLDGFLKNEDLVVTYLHVCETKFGTCVLTHRLQLIK